MARHGLLDTTSLTPPGAEGVAAAPPPGLDLEEAPNVSEADQAEYDQVLDNAYSLIYDDKSMSRILQSLTGQGNPVKGLADTVANVFSRLNESAIKAGRNISPDVLFSGGQEVLSDLADLAEKAGIHEYTDKEIEQATLLAVETFRNMQQKSGNLDPNAAAADFNALTEAETMGQLPEGVGDIAALGNLDELLANSTEGQQAAAAPAPPAPVQPAAPAAGRGLLNG